MTAAPAGPIVDTYGAGDSFAAALAFALARGDALDDALELAARAGSAVDRRFRAVCGAAGS